MYIDNNTNNQKLDGYIYEIARLMDNCNDRLAIFIEDSEFIPAQSENKDLIEQIKRSSALTCNVSEEDLSPFGEYIEKTITTEKFDYFVWISVKWNQFGIWFFIFLVAHEMKHIKQRMSYPKNGFPDIQELDGAFQRRLEENKNDRYRHDCPLEYDADIAAKWVLEQFYSQMELDVHFKVLFDDPDFGDKCSMRRILSRKGTLSYPFMIKMSEKIWKWDEQQH